MRTIDDLDVRGRRVLVRVDFNVPMARGPAGEAVVADDTRMRAALATIEELRGRGGRLVLISHLGRPEGRREADLSLAPVVARLRELTDAEVTFADGVVGRGGQGADRRAGRRRGAGARERPLRPGRDEQRSRLRPRAGGARRRLRQRRVRSSPPRAREHRGRGAAAAERRRAAAPARGRHAHRDPREPEPPAGGDHRGGQGGGQDRRHRPLPADRRRGDDRRGDVLPLPLRPGALGRRVAVLRRGRRARAGGPVESE